MPIILCYTIITKGKEIKKMTHEEFKNWLKQRAEELKKQGKNPHGLMRDLLIDMMIDELPN